ncbi:hypothetical protein [Alkalibacillus haloalkaliphilus]|uniref:hypothetical protein n=1 Tax=Alkalibacillus haloalkaliphilus TaxID=94136 RepID=UPI0002E1E161|nr:hypothetical protein [Alkalibacillus haloalkaliphilus]
MVYIGLDRIWKSKLVPVALSVVLVSLVGVLFYIEQSKHITMEQVITEEYGEDFEIDRLDIDNRINRTSVSIDDENMLREWNDLLHELELKRQESWPRSLYVLELYVDGNRHTMELDMFGNIFIEGQNYYIFNFEEVKELLEDNSIDWSE